MIAENLHAERKLYDSERTRGQSVSSPDENEGTMNVRELREEGPLPLSELPVQSYSVSDKRHGLATFCVNTGHFNRESVAYLFEEHDPEDVIRVFIEANPEVVENRSVGSLVTETGGYGKLWRKAARLVFPSAMTC
jgi:hypothetical protein